MIAKLLLLLKTLTFWDLLSAIWFIKPDPERMRPLHFPPPNNMNALSRVIGVFAYYAMWIFDFAEKIRPLASAKQFPLKGDALINCVVFVLLKTE